MEDIIKLLDRVLNIDFIRAVLSNPRDKEGIIKVKVRPLEKRGNLLFQFEAFTAKQAFHRNLEKEDAKAQFAEYAEQFRQMQIETVSDIYTVLISKKGKITVKRKQRREKAQAADLSHNRKKQYILEEGIPVPFLRDLGVMTEDGKIVRTKTDKFRQINRFLEFIEDENHSILLSSHITSDLEKIADYITFLHEGKVILTVEKDEIRYNYGIMRCRDREFEALEKEDMIAWKKGEYQIDVLVPDREKAARKYKDAVIDHASVDEAMLLMIKGERK